MKLEDMNVGEVVAHWHDTIAMGCDLVFSKIIKKGKTKVQVQTEFGEKRWKYPRFFDHKITDKDLLEELEPKFK